MNDISNKLDESITLITQSRTDVTGLSSAFEDFKQSLENQATQGPATAGEELTDSQVHRLIKNGRIAMDLILLSLYKSRNSVLPSSERMENTI
jgi:hypothetical protein